MYSELFVFSCRLYIISVRSSVKENKKKKIKRNKENQQNGSNENSKIEHEHENLLNDIFAAKCFRVLFSS